MANRFTQKAQNVLNTALRSASELGHTYIGSEHLLLGLMYEQNGVAAQLLAEKDADAEAIKNAIVRLSGIGSPSSVSPADMTPRTKSIIENSLYEAQKNGQDYIGTEHLLSALLSERDCVAVRILENIGVSLNDLRSDLSSFLSSTSSGDASEPTVSRFGATSEKKRDRKGGLDSAPTLKSFGRDLTELAKAGKIDPIIGRDSETERVIQILSRRTKNNPCLIGEPGVGKTAVVEGLAQRIVAGNVPENLREKTIVTLDIASMIAGAKYRGEFEERIKKIMRECLQNPNIILFIDEIHTIIGAGSAEGAIDAANILKPALSRGEIQIIGATTINEYRKHIERDPALDVVFNPSSLTSQARRTPKTYFWA